jgi:hypothetical protein
MESTNPGETWKAEETPAKFTFALRGNTVVEVSPRDKTDEYRFYERASLRAGHAPWKEVTRLASSTLIRG